MSAPESEPAGERGMPVMTVRLRPAVVVHNNLPTAALLAEYGVPAGGVLRLTSLDPAHKQELQLQVRAPLGGRRIGEEQRGYGVAVGSI